MSRRKLTVFVRQQQLKEWMKRAQEDIDASVFRMMIQLLMEYARRRIQSSAERNRDAAEIREYLIEIQTDKNLPSNPQVVPTVLEHLEIPPTTEAPGPSSPPASTPGDSRPAVEDTPPNDLEVCTSPNANSTLLEMTVEQCVKRLLAKRDDELRAVLLETHPVYTTGEQLSELLLAPFQPRSELLTPQDLEIRHNARAILLYWLKTVHLEISTSVLQQVQNSALVPREILDAVKQRVLPSAPSVPEPQSCANLDVTAKGLAAALTFKQSNLRIYTLDYLRRDSSQNIKAVLLLHDRLRRMVQNAVLRRTQASSRAQEIRLYLQTAYECLKMRNYASMTAIISALQSPIITNLRRTIIELPAHDRALLRRLGGLLDPRENYDAYRKSLKNTSQTYSQCLDSCIPWLEAHLRILNIDITPVTFDNIEPAVINFGQYLSLVRKVRQYQPSFSPDWSAGHLAFVEERLEAIGDVNDTTLVERSNTVRQQEERRHTGRIDAMESLGM
ncbi:ras guanine nucleotide exchange factor domain-containing protein [Mycena floridula]|nr:ras guanine nucleotide exchange factor domain-containing protein [Mycena floridula]